MATKSSRTSSSSKRSSSSRARATVGVKLGARTVEICPVGAWVQPGSELTFDPVMSARVEEARVARIQLDKQARLQNFQEEVKRRVLALDRIKKQQQMNELLKAVTVERKVVTQSEHASDKHTPRKNSCSIRREAHLSIQASNQSTADGGRLNQRDEFCRGQFDVQIEQVHRLNSVARASLATRQVITGQLTSNDLSGRLWGSGPVIQLLVTEIDEEPADRFTANEISTDEHCFERTAGVEEKPFEVRRRRTERNILRRASATTLGDMNVRIPCVRPGLETEKEKQRSRTQRALYRRVFMDIERTQVKENLRQRDHRTRMAQLKKSKEGERIRLEEDSQRNVEPIDPLTGRTADECEQEESTELELSMLSLGEHERLARKQQDVKRFVQALRRNLKEKMESQRLDIPQLCACGPTVWYTNPDTCANNCVYYKNPKGYARALQCLLASCDVF